MTRAGLLAGPSVLRRGFALLWRERSLWPVAALPFFVNVAAFGVAVAVFVANLDVIAAPIQRALDPGEPSVWFGWLWVGPLLVLALAVKAVLLVALGVAIYFGFTVVGALVAAPFLDLLSERVERLVSGEAPRARTLGESLRVAARSVVEEGKRTAFFLAVQLGLVLFGLFPGVQPVAAAASLAFTALFLPLDFTAYSLDRRGVPFAVLRECARCACPFPSGPGFAATRTRSQPQCDGTPPTPNSHTTHHHRATLLAQNT